MKLGGWIKVTLAGAVGGIAAFAAQVFRVACLPLKEKETPVEENVSPLWSAYREQVIGGVHWFRAQALETVEIVSDDGLRLRGKYLPHENAKGTILLFHGYHSDGYTDFSCAFALYYSLGYSVLCVFQRAHGESEGDYICYGVRERYDCLRWAEYAARRFGPDHPLFLGGISMGASTVLMATGLLLPSSVCGIIADCGFTSPWEEIGELLRRRYHVPARPILELTDRLTRRIAGFGLREYSTLDAMKTNRIPVLFVHGEADHFVSPRFTMENYDACRAEKRLVLVPGASHGVSFLVDRPRCEQALRDFLAAHTPQTGDAPC